ncbi:oral facial digital syndrome 1 protein [Echinococcus multilocularis]|uniref:Oral facial digital syndrome 1 protein n=1 Tax=Echinococcus multilocularis TaxID=6211 RepID=A0A087W290_ECHMU|nr:oral facial digital syndrome 1 protein [Echinococcus multilocularis]
MEEQTSDMTPQNFRRKLVHNLKSKGIFEELKANLRQKLIDEMHFKSSEHHHSPFLDLPLLYQKIACSLCLEYLRKQGYWYTLSVLVPEAGLQNSGGFSRDELISVMQISEFCKNNQAKFSCLSNPTASLLYNIVSYFTLIGSANMEDKCIQVGPDCDSFLYEIQLEKIDAKYDSQQKFDAEQIRRNFEGKVLQLRGEVEEGIYNDYHQKLEAFKRNTLNEIKKEIEHSANTKIHEKSLQLEEVYAVQKAALDEREKHLNVVMTKSMEANERTNLFQRQILAAETEACRVQMQKARQVEADLERQRKELQDNFCKRRARLQIEEEELLARKQAFNDIVKQEVERLRKSDEVELLNKRRELEITETCLAIEKNALEARRNHVLALQEEVSQKSALFSQMEITDYETLKMKLSASANEISTLKERLGQAFEEIDGLRQGAVIASSERNLLLAAHRENESLRAALEQERTNNNKERIGLNVKIEELRAEKNRLEERVCLWQSEVSRLRGLLADQRRSCPPDSRIFAATATAIPAVPRGVKGDFCDESQAPAVSTKTVITGSSSATVETARERLKALEQESVKLEEALGQWKEEICTVPPIPKASEEAITKRVQQNGSTLLRSGFSTAYLNSFRTASSIPTLGQFPPSWPMPFMRSMASAIEAARDGTCGETSELAGIHHHFERKVSTPAQQAQTMGTNNTKKPSQESTTPRVATTVVTTPSADIAMSHRKASSFIISMRSIPKTLDKTNTIVSVVPEKEPLANHSNGIPLKVTSQSTTPSSVTATVDPVDQEIREGPQCEAVPLTGSGRQTPCRSTDQTHNTDILDDDCEDVSSTKQVGTGGIGNEAERHLADMPSRGSQEEEEEGDKRLGSSSSTAIDPMSLKYVKVLQEQRLVQKSEVEPVLPIVAEDQGPEATKTSVSFGGFLAAQQFDSDLSSTEGKSVDISVGEPISVKSEEYGNSDNFW